MKKRVTKLVALLLEQSSMKKLHYWLERILEVSMGIWMCVVTEKSFLHNENPIRLWCGVIITILFIIHLLNEVGYTRYIKVNYLLHWGHLVYWYGCIIITSVLCIMQKNFMTEYGSLLIAMMTGVDLWLWRIKDEKVNEL